MTAKELGAVALKDPFMRYYTSVYLGVAGASNKITEKYNNVTFGQEIKDISEYLKLSAFFQSTFEPVVGVNIAVFFILF